MNSWGNKYSPGEIRNIVSQGVEDGSIRLPEIKLADGIDTASLNEVFPDLAADRYVSSVKVRDETGDFRDIYFSFHEITSTYLSWGSHKPPVCGKEKNEPTI